MQSVPITTKIVSLNLAHVEVYSIQHYVIKFVSDLQQISALLSSTNKTDRHDIAGVLLKVASNTIALALTYSLVHSVLLDSYMTN